MDVKSQMVKNSKFFRTFWPTLWKRLGRSRQFCTRMCACLCRTYWTTFGIAYFSCCLIFTSASYRSCFFSASWSAVEYVEHCIISTFVVAFEINYLILSYHRNGSCPMHEWDHPPIFWVFNSPSPAPRGRWAPQGEGACRQTLSLHK